MLILKFQPVPIYLGFTFHRLQSYLGRYISRFNTLIDRWERLRRDSERRKTDLLQLQEQYKKVEELYLTFAKRASMFNSWFENAEEDLTDPVRCNSLDEVRALSEAQNQFKDSLKAAEVDFQQLAQLDHEIKNYGVSLLTALSLCEPQLSLPYFAITQLLQFFAGRYESVHLVYHGSTN